MSNHIPATLDVHALARLLAPILYLSENTLVRDFDRKEDLFPPFSRPVCKKIYVTQVVIDFYPLEIGVEIRRALEREWEKKEGKILGISAVKARPAPPATQSLLEILMPASASGSV